MSEQKAEARKDPENVLQIKMNTPVTGMPITCRRFFYAENAKKTSGNNFSYRYPAGHCSNYKESMI